MGQVSNCEILASKMKKLVNMAATADNTNKVEYSYPAVKKIFQGRAQCPRSADCSRVSFVITDDAFRHNVTSREECHCRSFRSLRMIRHAAALLHFQPNARRHLVTCSLHRGSCAT